MKEKIITTEQVLKKLPIYYVGDNFKKWFYPMKSDPDNKIKTLISQKLSRSMNDETIIKELNPGEVSIEEIVGTLKTMDHSFWAIFYCKDISNVLRTVDVRWGGGGWYVSAREVSDPLTWRVGRRVFSRNSCDAKAIGSFYPLALGRFETLKKRVKELEEWIRIKKRKS